MRWWLNTDHKTFSVDNAGVRGVDTSALSPDIWMVQWTEGKGEIERQTLDGENENGLREGFYDISPYVPFFKQFLTLMQANALELSQAKKIQIDLIAQLFESKRQLPIHYPVAAGDYWWDASDVGPMAANTTATVADLVTTVNALVGYVNTIEYTLNNVASYLNNTLVYQINTNIVAGVNAAFYDLNTQTVYYANVCDNLLVQAVAAIQAHININVLPPINTKLQTSYFNVPSGETSVTIYAAMPGLAGAIGDIAATSHPYTIPQAQGGAGGVGAMGWSNFGANHPGVSLTSVQWIPIGSTVPVTLTPAESKGLMDAINNRTKQLQSVKTTKIAEVNALTTVPAVINYDVLAGWPVIPLPPGYVPQAPTKTASSVSVIGTPSAGGGGDGIPEAPNNGVTYGRRNMAWNPALALAGDVLDGGNF